MLLPQASAIIVEGSGNIPDQRTLAGKLEDVKAAVAALPNTTELFPTRDSYRDVGYAIKASLPDHQDEAYELFAQWAARWPGDENTPLGNDPGVVASDWSRMKPPFKRGASWLYELAHKHSGGAFDVARVWFELVREGDEPDTSAFVEAGMRAPAVFASDPIDLFGDEDPFDLANPPSGSLPEVIERWATTEARRKGVSRAFAAASAVSVLAAAIGNSLRLRVRMHDTGWTEPASLWVVLVAEPGRAKSPIIGAAVAPLRAVNSERYERDAATYNAWKTATVLRKKNPAAPDPGPEPTIRRSVVDDITMEQQVKIHAANPHGLLRATDELQGLLGALGAYKPGASADRSHMLAMFDGREIIVDRVSAGAAGSIRAKCALMGIIAGTQPEKVREIVKELGSDGMLQRFLHIVDDGASRTGLDEAPDADAVREYERVVRGLATTDYFFPDPITLSQAAYLRLEEAKRDISKWGSLPGSSREWRGHVEKWGKLLPRLVLTFHAVEVYEMLGSVPDDIAVSEGTATKAIGFAEFLLRHSWQFYRTYFGSSEEASEACKIAGYILTRPDRKELTPRDIYTARTSLQGAGQRRLLLRAMAELEQAGWCEPVGGSPHDGPKHWRVNPRVHERFRERAARERAERAAAQEKIAAACAIRRRGLAAGHPTEQRRRT